LDGFSPELSAGDEFVLAPIKIRVCVSANKDKSPSTPTSIQINGSRFSWKRAQLPSLFIIILAIIVSHINSYFVEFGY
jgi:hypothetical protein